MAQTSTSLSTKPSTMLGACFNTSLDRRAFLSSTAMLAAGVAAGLAIAPRRAQAAWSRLHAETYFEWSKVADNCHLAMGEGGNSLAVIGKGEIFVIDSKNGGFGTALRREADALGSPVKTLINTHHHADHTGGNPAFTKDLTVIAHEKAEERIVATVERSNKAAQGAIAQLKQSPKAAAKQVIADVEALLKTNLDGKSYAPNKLMPASGNLSIGGVSVELYHMGAGHTDNDLIVFIPEYNVLHSGDLLFNSVWPYFDPANSGADSAGWIRSCEKILELATDKTVIVPGHGAAGTVEIAKKQIAFFKHMREVAAKAVAAGTSREEFTKQTPEEYKDYAAGDWIRPIALGGLWDEAKVGK
jgi:cyclase